MLHAFVEFDQGTEHTPTLRAKLGQYERAYRGEVGGSGLFPRVIWLVSDSHRAFQLRQLLRSPRLTADLHAVALHSEALAALTGGNIAERPPPHSADA